MGSGPGTTVTVACKIPSGLRLRLFKMEMRREAVMGGGYREFEQAKTVGKSYVVRGPARPQSLGEPGWEINAAFALTPGIPADFWEEWLKQNAEADYVVNRQIFAAPKQEDAIAKAREVKKEKTGLERLDPDRLPMRKIKTETKNEDDA